MTMTPTSDDPVFDIADMDPATAPGDDFYQFVNGGWRAANPVPDDYSRWAAFEEVRHANEELLHELMKKAVVEPGAQGTPSHWCGSYFAAGLDTETIEAAGLDPLQPWLDRIEAIQGVSELSEVASDLQAYGISLPIGAGVVPDFVDSTRNLMYLGSGGMGLPEKEYYFRDDEHSADLRRQYQEHITKMLELSDHSEPSAAAAEIMRFETALAENAYTAAEQRDMDLVLNRHSVDELTELMPAFGLAGFMERFGATGIEAVNVGNPAFFRAADRLISETDSEVLQAWGRWHLLTNAASALPSDFENESFRFFGQILGGQKEQKARWKRVLRAASADIGQLVARLYVDAAFSPEAKQRAEEMVEHIISAMGRSIAGLDWMTEETKAAAATKLDGFVAKLGYPDEWRDYAALEFKGGPWVNLRMAASRFEFDRRLGELHEPVNPHEWEMGAHEVNAYYHPLRNEIVFPAGILQPPFFQADADDAVNYGGIGAVIGHEITHGFDDMGSRFDADGNFANWWSEKDREEFERRAQVLVDQYTGYQPIEGLTINGQLTLGENIADLGGVTLAYQALAGWLDEHGRTEVGGLSPEQRFFMSFARVWRINSTDEYLRLAVQTDPHSPGEYRCNGTLANVAEFAEAFDLPADSPMMRPQPERAKIW